MHKPIITFVFAAAGNDKHFINVQRAINSLTKIKSVSYKIQVITDKARKRTISDGVEWIPYSGDLSRKERHQYWRMRYDLHKYVDTDYTMYCDSDTVLCNDTIVFKISEIGELFGICQHFWVPTLFDYIQKACNLEASKEISILSNGFNTPFIASGAFIFKNSSRNINIIKRVGDYYNMIYPKGSPYREGLTDEVWLTLALQGQWRNVHLLGGSFNHCCEKQIMPIRMNGDIIEGKNPFECENFEPITLLHCDPFRRDPSIGYDQKMSDKIKELFQLC